MKLLVGCPVHNRAWILPKFFEHLRTAVKHFDVSCVFVGARGDDDTWDAIAHSCPFPFIPVFVDEPVEPHLRDWGVKGRVQHMVYLRNVLLHNVRIENPEVFLSVDSDILLHRDAITFGLQHLKYSQNLDAEYDAVGLGCHMLPLLGSGSEAAPSGANLNRHGHLVRGNLPKDFHRVDVIMAAKLMSPSAYNIDYVYDQRGEDIGWSQQCTRTGLKLGWDNRIVSRHVMSPGELVFDDPRISV